MSTPLSRKKVKVRDAGESRRKLIVKFCNFFYLNVSFNNWTQFYNKPMTKIGKENKTVSF